MILFCVNTPALPAGNFSQFRFCLHLFVGRYYAALFVSAALSDFLPAVIPEFPPPGEFVEEVAQRRKGGVVALHVDGERVGGEGELLVLFAELFGEEYNKVVAGKIAGELQGQLVKCVVV